MPQIKNKPSGEIKFQSQRVINEKRQEERRKRLNEIQNRVRRILQGDEKT